MPEQERIVLPPSEEPDPSRMDCEWCRDPSRPAKHAIQLMKKVRKGAVGKRQFLYACDDHLHTAEEMARGTSG